MKPELKLFDIRRDIYFMPKVIFCRWSVHDTEYTWVFNDQLLAKFLLPASSGMTTSLCPHRHRLKRILSLMSSRNQEKKVMQNEY